MKLVVAYSSDNNYCRHLLVSAISLMENNKEFDNIKIYVIDNGIDEKNKHNLLQYAQKYNAEIIFSQFSNIEKKLKTDNKFPLSAYGRLFLDDIVNEDKVLYLDCDSAINGSFFDLWTLDMEDNICLAVQDNVSAYFKTSIGMAKEDIYFNSGVLLIDLKKWRDLDMQNKAINMIIKYNGSVPHHDQGVINSICYKKIKKVHPKYNFQCPMFEYTPEQLNELIDNYYSAEELKEAFENPVFIHYTEGYSNRPWRKNSTHPLKSIYRKYQDMTEYKGDYEDRDLNANAKKMLWAYKNLPFFLYKKILYLIEVRKNILRRKHHS